MNTQAISWIRGRAGRYAAATLGAGAVGLALGAFAPAAQAAAPKTLYVSQTGLDSGTCTSASPCATVSYALTKAASGATIEVSGTIDDNPVISHPVTITTWAGGPADSPGVLDGGGDGTVVTNSATGVTLNDLTIENGGQRSSGAGITNTGTMAVTDSTVSGNGGADAVIYNGGTMTITDSTISGNTAAGIDNGAPSPGVLTIIASTIADNSGGGIESSNEGAVAHLAATIVADNTGFNCDPVTESSFESAGYNLTNDKTGTACSFDAATDLVNKDPLLGHLAGNGGPTQTMLPGTASPAADVIPNPTTLRGVAVCPGTDQRGVARPGHGETRCTIGAVEAAFNIATTTSVTLSPTKVTAGTRVVYLAVVTPKSGTGTPTGTITFITGSTSLCTAVLSGGVAACGATNAPTGTDKVTGTYSGGGGYATSSGTATLTVTAG
jgi:hypothetical protein